jgi:hypothetical protein
MRMGLLVFVGIIKMRSFFKLTLFPKAIIVHYDKYESYNKHFVARTGLGHDELARRDIIHYFFYFAPFKQFCGQQFTRD